MASYPAWKPWNECPEGWPGRAWQWVKIVGGAYLALCFFILFTTYSTLWAARPEIAVPNVIGQQQGDAIRLLKQNGLVVQVLDGAPSDTSRPGEIIHQSLTPGTHVRQGRTIYLVECPGPATAVVPKVLMVDSTDALKAIAAVGLDGEVALSEDSPTVPFDEVIRQQPPPGVRVPAGSSVVLILSDGPPDTSDSTPGAAPTTASPDSAVAQDNLIPVTPGDWAPPASPSPAPAGAMPAGGTPGAVPGYPMNGSYDPGDSGAGYPGPANGVMAGGAAAASGAVMPPGAGADEAGDPSDPFGPPSPHPAAKAGASHTGRRPRPHSSKPAHPPAISGSENAAADAGAADAAGDASTVDSASGNPPLSPG